MHSSGLFLKCNRLLLDMFVKEVASGICHSSPINFALFATATRGIKAVRTCGGSCDQIPGVSSGSQMNSCRTCFSEVPQSSKILQIPQKIDVKALKVDKFKGKHESRKIAVITKSGNPDIFGDMEDFIVEDTLHVKIGEDSSFHEDCEIFVPLERKYHSAHDYLKGMEDLVKEKKLKQALELFLDMKRHHVPPLKPHYTVMIGACGRAGYTEMAFKLLRQMTDKGFMPTPATLTGLFNSCAESPDAHYGLKKAIFLKEKVLLKSWEVTAPTYHAMIKAFGRCGDIKTAFEIVDDMIESGCRVSVETYNALMIACVSDKDAGFTHAVEVWRKMTAKNIHPNIYSYNLLLRAVRDCGVGPEEVSCKLLHHWSSCYSHLSRRKKEKFSQEDVQTLPHFSHGNIKLLSDPLLPGNGSVSVQQKKTWAVGERKTESANFSLDDNRNEHDMQTPGRTDNLISHSFFNLLSARSIAGPKLIDLEKIKNPADRLLLIGGVKGLLELMRKDEVVPDIKTFTLLLKIIPNSTVCENELLELIESCKLKPDADFFNMLIKKRNFRKDFRAAKDVLILITKKGLCPNIVTFGVLALGCIRKKDGLQLLLDMKNLGYCPNVEIFGALLNSASRLLDFEYICTVMKTMTAEQIKPSPQFLQMLEDIKNTAHDKILAVEQHEESPSLPFSEKSYEEFCQLYEQWLKTTDVEEQADPWLQYKTEITNVV